MCIYISIIVGKADECMPSNTKILKKRNLFLLEIIVFIKTSNAGRLKNQFFTNKNDDGREFHH